MTQKQKEQFNICLLMATFLFAFTVIVSTKAYARPFQEGGVFYQPQEQKEMQTPAPLPIVAPEPDLSDKTDIVGVASWYDYDLENIEWSKTHRTAASRDLKRYSMARVTNLDNGKSVDVFINDFGPEEGQIPERHIDLSSYAFSLIADLEDGLANVKIEQL